MKTRSGFPEARFFLSVSPLHRVPVSRILKFGHFVLIGAVNWTLEGRTGCLCPLVEADESVLLPAIVIFLGMVDIKMQPPTFVAF